MKNPIRFFSTNLLAVFSCIVSYSQNGTSEVDAVKAFVASVDSINNLGDQNNHFLHFIEDGVIAQKLWTVYAIKEDKWMFYAEGSHLKIEDTGNYSKRTIKDRLNNKIVLEYMKRAGYDLQHTSFFTSSKPIILFSS